MLRPRRPRDPLLAARRAGAALLALAAVVLALRPAGRPPAAAPATGPVVVAAADLPAGTTLGAGNLRTVPVPPPLRAAGSSSAPGELLGRVLASPVRAGEPLTDVRLVGAGLTALLPPGQVAAPVRLADLAVTGLVRAGDRVDVLAAVEGTDRAEQVASAALVLAAPGAGSGAGDASGEAPGGLLLLAVDPATAARLAAASAAATLTVTLTGR